MKAAYLTLCLQPAAKSDNWLLDLPTAKSSQIDWGRAWQGGTPLILAQFIERIDTQNIDLKTKKIITEANFRLAGNR